MKPTLLFLTAFCLLISTKLTAQSDQNTKIRALQAINVWPIAINDETNDTLVYFFRNDTVLLRTTFTSRNMFFSADEEEPDSVAVSSAYRYFLYKKGATKGLWLEDYKISQARFSETDLVDSVLAKKQGYFTIPLTELMQSDSMSLISTKMMGQQIEKTYIFNKHTHLKGADTLILEFNPAFKHADFHFYNYPPAEENMALSSMKMIIQCDEAIQKNMLEFALIKMHHYLTEVPHSVIAEAEKYFALFSRPHSIASGQ